MTELKKTKILFTVFFLLVFISLAFCFYRFIIRKNYITFTNENDIPSDTDFIKSFGDSIKNGHIDL